MPFPVPSWYNLSERAEVRAADADGFKPYCRCLRCRKMRLLNRNLLCDDCCTEEAPDVGPLYAKGDA